MNEDTLRRWARGTLDATERRAVSRWLVRCTDPNLGPLLHGMLQEARDEAADHRLAGLGGAWASLVDAWSAMLDSGRAALVAGLSPPIVLAADGTPEEPPLSLVRVDGFVHARLTIPDNQEAAIYLTDDAGRIARVLSPGAYTTGEHQLPTTSGERATIWAVWGPALPRTEQPLGELQAALSSTAVSSRAIRLQDDT